MSAEASAERSSSRSLRVNPDSVFTVGEEEAGEQDEERPAERRVPGAARQAEALLQNR